MQSFENLLQNYSTEFLYCMQKVLGYVQVCVIKACSNRDATYIIIEIIAKENLNIVNLMQTSVNLLLQNY